MTPSLPAATRSLTARGTANASPCAAQSARDGYALEDEEEYEEIACVAAPVFDATGRCCGGISVTGCRADVLGDERRMRVIEAVCATAAGVSTAMGAPARVLTTLTAVGRRA
ncbi:IclR family transcriptional regulator C-terminal domain-containing protein [Conexibacter sp. JD483]|uniref:IclR family transcriptional regulator domain-containing protein n=1 Tax=unclassified Conexibacter TaxID=2627773 RepID=UPI0027283C9F|nr:MULTISPECIES: IclR family transcriptional regulator C-terminal domain-containing protein [unclassified Conexibacter]MDO8184762.1 IclR family transcriptional regulator C-terminal domain-containing protein [Conexibacter sp. CPCC 205706]MDO8196537.1 IclR family transcriptional regulator C-terminal domain-containing protein [Conexibacter sp. CPCC 205762]MDR9369023.1 IclR family transcriptional regulator C-terminal domain-containing protein [Conexibacter sp. JD483]